MTTATSALTVPAALEEWRPACDMHYMFMQNSTGTFRPQPCGNAATLAVILHTRCGTTVSCPACFIKFSAEACRRASITGGDHECGVCRVTSPYLSKILRAVPL